MDGKAAYEYAMKLNARVSSEPGWDFWGQQDLPEWYMHAMSAVTLLSESEEPAYVSGRYDESAATGTLHLFFANSIVTIKARNGASDIDRSTVTEQPRGHLRSLEVHVGKSPSDNPRQRDEWPGKVWVTARYADGPPIELPVSPTNDTRMSKELRGFLPSLRADLDARPAQP